MTYVIQPQYRELLTDEEWSFTDFLNDGKRKFEETYFGFQETISAVTVCQVGLLLLSPDSSVTLANTAARGAI